VSAARLPGATSQAAARPATRPRKGGRDVRDASTLPERLPRGRHGLSRDEVAAVQRKRMFDALARVITAKGYTAATVSDVIELAGVSRETFYEQFKSKQECFEQAFDQAASAMVGALGAELAPGGTPVELFERLLGTYLELLSANPELARLFLVEVYAAGPEANRRRSQVQEQLVGAVVELFAARDQSDRFACEALVAATSSMVTGGLLAGRADDLVQLRDPLTTLAARLFGP
jgi:AcrR family transcriptional regulator